MVEVRWGECLWSAGHFDVAHTAQNVDRLAARSTAYNLLESGSILGNRTSCNLEAIVRRDQDGRVLETNVSLNLRTSSEAAMSLDFLQVYNLVFMPLLQGRDR